MIKFRTTCLAAALGWFALAPVGRAGQPPAPPPRPAGAPAPHPATPEEKRGVTPDSQAATDRAYRAVLGSVEGLEAVRKQQPDNLKAVERGCDDLRKRVADLRVVLAPKAAAPDATAKTGPPPAQVGTGQTAAPAGPVKPSQVPSTADEREKRRQATEHGSYLPGPGFAPTPPKSLRGVPDESVRRGCDATEKVLKELTDALKQERPDRKKVDQLVGRLREEVDRLAVTPAPPPTEPVRPRPGKD